MLLMESTWLIAIILYLKISHFATNADKTISRSSPAAFVTRKPRLRCVENKKLSSAKVVAFTLISSALELTR